MAWQSGFTGAQAKYKTLPFIRDKDILQQYPDNGVSLLVKEMENDFDDFDNFDNFEDQNWTLQIIGLSHWHHV